MDIADQLTTWATERAREIPPPRVLIEAALEIRRLRIVIKEAAEMLKTALPSPAPAAEPAPGSSMPPPENGWIGRQAHPTDTVRTGHKFAPAQIGDDEALEHQPSWWRRRFWRLLRFVVFCGLVFVIAYLATLLRDSAP